MTESEAKMRIALDQEIRLIEEYTKEIKSMANNTTYADFDATRDWLCYEQNKITATLIGDEQ